MKTEVLSQEKNVLVVKAEFEAAEVNSAIAKTVNTLSLKANIKGFRKGHVPRRAIELYFGKQGIYQETLEDILQSAVEQSVEEYDLDLISHPDVKPSELEENKPFSVEITFEVTPEITLPELSSLEAEKIIYSPSEEMEQQNIDKMLEMLSELNPLYEEREIRPDDYVSVKFSSSIVNEDGSATPVEADQKTEIFLGQQNIRPQITDALTGKKPGDKVTIEFPVEEEADDKEMAGKNMRYEIEVLGLMKRDIPELTDETAEKISSGQYKTVDEFRQSIRDRLQASADRESAESLKASAVEKLVEASEVDLPESLVKRQAEALKQEQAKNIQKESGLSLEEFFEKSGIDIESYEAETEASARRIVKRSLVLEAIAKREDIHATPEEFNSELQRMAMAARMEYDKFRSFVMAENERVYEISARITNRKAIDFLTAQVKVTEVSEADKAAQSEAMTADRVEEDTKEEENQTPAAKETADSGSDKPE